MNEQTQKQFKDFLQAGMDAQDAVDAIVNKYAEWWIGVTGNVACQRMASPPRKVEVMEWVNVGIEDGKSVRHIEAVHVFPFAKHAYMFVDEMGAVRGHLRPTNVLATLLYQQASLWRGDTESAKDISYICGPAVVVINMEREEDLT